VTVPAPRVGLLVVLVAVLALPGTAAAAPVLVHEATTITESAPRNGVIEGGDTITISERLRNTSTDPISSLAGTLTTADPDVDITQHTSTYPTIAAIDTAVNDAAFVVTLPAALPCGAVVELSLALSAPGLDASVPVTIRTGYDGAATPQYPRGRPTDIPNGTASLNQLASFGGPGTGTSSISVPAGAPAANVRGIEVHLGHLDYPLGHLRISLRAPGGDQVVLLDHRGGAAQSLDDTVFAADEADPALTSNLSGARVRPEESFDALLGNTRAGTWKLVFQVDDSTELGSLDDWDIAFTLADCVPRAFASLVATPSQVAPSGDVLLDASGTVVDGPATYAYSSTLGGFASITGGATAQAHVTFTTHGLHLVTVTVHDVHGAVFTSDVGVVVSNLPVAVLPTPANAFTGVPITFNAAGSSDSDPGTITFEWSVDGGAFAPGSPTRAVSFATPGQHYVTVRVTDADGATDEATASVTATNRPPVAALALAAGTAPAVTGRQTVLDAGASHDDGTIVAYRWDLDGDLANGFEVDGGTSPTHAMVFATHGPHPVRVQVTDDNGLTGVAPLTVAVTDAPVAGAIQASPAQPRVNADVTLSVTGASDPDGTIDHYEWDFGDGTQATSVAPSIHHAFAARALRTITVRVVDDQLAGSTTTMALQIGGIAPVAVLTATPNPVVGAAVHFDASGSHDPDSAISRYAWDLNGDGVCELDTGLTATAQSSYPNAGTLTLHVCVTDADGNIGVAGVVLAISAPPSAPGAGNATPDGPGAGDADAGPAAPDAADGPGAGAAGPAAFAAALAGDAIQTQNAVLRSGIVVACRANRSATCVLRIELAAKDARRLGLKAAARQPFVLARATIVTHGASPGTARLRLSKATAAKLRHAARVTVLVTGVATSAGGDESKLSRAILLRRR
jgi:subtilisin-like proprotein convertase family protein